MPFFMDQKPNMKILVDKGVGVYLNFETLSVETILDAFDKVLYNERYDRYLNAFAYFGLNLL